MKKNIRHDLIAILVYVTIVLVAFGPVLIPPEGQLIFGDDIHRSYHFFRVFAREWVSRGIIPWWNPMLNSGEPFVANPSVTFWYPPNWLFFFFHHRFVYSWIIVFHILLAMVGMYWLARQWVSRMSAWLAGLVFGLSGFFMGRIWEGHIDIITSAPYLPIVFGLFWRGLNEKSNRTIVLAGLAFGLQMYAGYQTMAFFTGLTLVAMTVLFILKKRSLVPILQLTVGVVIAIGFAALQLIPAQEFFRLSIRTHALPYSWVVMGSYTLDNLKQLFFPFILGGPGNYKGPSPNYGELAAYVGVVPLLLTIWALRRKTITILFFFLLAIFALWVSFGPNAPIDLQYILWKTIPTYKYLRVPSRHLYLFVFPLAILAGFGLESIRKQRLRQIFILIAVVDLVFFARAFITLKPDPQSRHNKTLIKTLTTDTSLYRLLPNFNVGMGTRDALDFDASMAYEIPSASGYDPSILRSYYDFMVATKGLSNFDVQTSDVQIPYIVPNNPFTDFLNIKYILVPTWFDSVGGESSRFRILIEENEQDFFRLYENKTVLPRFYFVSEVKQYKDQKAVREAIRTSAFDPHTTIATSSIPSRSIDASCTQDSEISVVLYTPNTVTLKTLVSCDSILSTSEVMYPGWEMTIDGQKKDIVVANLAFRAAPVPKGKHTIQFIYNPKIFVISFGISATTLVASIIFILRRRL